MDLCFSGGYYSRTVSELKGKSALAFAWGASTKCGSWFNGINLRSAEGKQCLSCGQVRRAYARYMFSVGTGVGDRATLGTRRQRVTPQIVLVLVVVLDVVDPPFRGGALSRPSRRTSSFVAPPSEAAPLRGLWGWGAIVFHGLTPVATDYRPLVRRRLPAAGRAQGRLATCPPQVADAPKPLWRRRGFCRRGRPYMLKRQARNRFRLCTLNTYTAHAVG